MALQFSIPVGNARLDAVESTIGTSAILTIRTGAQPSDCSQANSGTVLATINLPSDWMTNAASRTKSKSGTWEDTSADNAGTAGHFRIHDSTGTTCGIQGSVTATGGGGQLTLDNVVIASGQDVVITAFALTDGNA